MKKLLPIACALLTLVSCYNDNYNEAYPGATTCDTTTVSYSADIVPILNTNCAISGGCHDAAGASVSGHNYTNYAGIKAVASYDFLITDITGNPMPGHNSMPKNGNKLSECDIDKMIRWVNEGAPDN
ncbi:MAG TPA: hypothetical protein VN721_15680 [Flavipsychrobacter sp.]|nr:hypothetical protein [Flavipsychrobacter sp.]